MAECEERAADVDKSGRSVSFQSQVDDASMIPLPTLRLRNWRSGNQMRISEVGTASEGWSLPAGIFHVNDLVGQYVVKIGRNNEVTQEHFKVSAVLTQNDAVAPLQYQLSEVADKEGWVRVLTGVNVLPFTGRQYTYKPAADLSGVRTPETPSDRSDSE